MRSVPSLARELYSDAAASDTPRCVGTPPFSPVKGMTHHIRTTIGRIQFPAFHARPRWRVGLASGARPLARCRKRMQFEARPVECASLVTSGLDRTDSEGLESDADCDCAAPTRHSVAPDSHHDGRVGCRAV